MFLSVISTSLFLYVLIAIMLGIGVGIFSLLRKPSETPLSVDQILHSLHEVVIGVNEENGIIFLNTSAEDLFHVSSKNLIQKTTLQTLISNDVSYQELNSLLEKTKKKTVISPIKIWIGNTRLLITTIIAGKMNTNKGPYYIIGTDVSPIEKDLYKAREDTVVLQTHLDHVWKEKQSLELLANQKITELEAEHARLESAMEHMSLGFIMIDKEENLSIANNAAIQLFNLRYPSVIPIVDDLTSKLTNEALEKGIANTLKGITIPAIKDVLYENKYLNFYLSPVIIEKNDVIGTVMVIEDETESKIIERSKEEFFTIASHELRTPLTAIRGFVSLLKTYYNDQITDDQIKLIINNIESSSIRLISIVNDFLDSTKIEQGKLQMEIAQYDIIPIITDVITECNPMAKEKKLYLHFEKPANAVYALVDRNRLKQVIMNLVGNAIKFTDTGSITITVTERFNNTIVVRVVDTGRGIPEKNRYLLFKKFNQAGSDLYTRDASGTGLGLYISKLLLNKMGGSIELESSVPGKGSVFTFTIPNPR